MALNNRPDFPFGESSAFFLCAATRGWMGRATEREKIFLQMRLQKSLQRDADGNVIFTVEASNENLDLQGEKVLQDALLGSKGHFLKNGVVTKDHKHRKWKDGGYELDESYVIGEPLDVYTQGTSTFVKGKLYAKNEYARKFIELLDQGSSRVKASVGGLVPRVKNVVENGRKIGKVVSVLWDDLALTIAPVNPTVESATSLAKSLSGAEFVKALSVGHGTDSATFTGGRALQKEGVEHEKILSMNLANVDEKVVAALVGAIADGDVSGGVEVEAFLENFGISNADARAVARALCMKGNQFTEVFPMAKRSAWDEIKAGLKKSFGGEKPKDEGGAGDPDPNQGGGSGNDDDGDDGDGDEFEDAGPLVKALTEKVDELQNTVEMMVKSQSLILEQFEKSATMQKSLGEGMLALMDRTEEVIASPTPRKSATTQLEAMMAKALGGGGAAPGVAGGGGATGGGLKPFTKDRIDRMQGILIKAVSDGELDIHTCGKYETHMNKSVGRASYPFPDDMVEFLRKKISA